LHRAPGAGTMRLLMELVERETVLVELTELLAEADQGKGRVALVSGEAGIGKTAVVEQFCRRNADRVRVLAGACDPLVTPRPLGPLVDIAASVGGELGRLLAQASDPGPVFDAFLRILAGAREPTVVVLEDLHWADQATLDLLCFVGRRIARTRTLVIATFRDDELELDHPLRLAVGNLPGVPVVRRLPLQPLTEQGVGVLARGRRPDAERLHRLSGGNPFFLAELLTSGGDELPATVRDAVLARASRLSEGARADLDVLAAVGRPVTRTLLSELDVTDRHVQEEVFRGLLRWEDGRVAFRHELGRAAVLDALPPGQAAIIHRRILAALRESAADHDAAELAHHAEEAEDEAAVLEYASRAAQDAQRLSAHRQAAAQYERVLRFAASLPAEEQAALHEARSREAYLSADTLGAVASARGALDLRRGLGDSLAVGRTLSWLALVVWHTEDHADAVPLAREAVELLAGEAPSSELAGAYSMLASLHASAAEASEAEVYAREASRLAEQLGLVDVRIQALRTLGAARLCGPEESGWAELDMALELALGHDFRSEAAAIYESLVWFGAMHRQFDRFDAFFPEGLAFCERHDLLFWRLALLQGRSVELLHRGRWTEAGELAQALLAETGIALSYRIQPLYVLGRLRARRGDPEVWAPLDEALALAAPRNELQFVGNVRAVRAEAAWLEGDRAHMVEEATAAYSLAVPVGDPWILGELALWLWRGGALEQFDPVLEGHPYGLQIEGDWAGAAAAWERLGCPFETAAALLDSDEERALRRALQIFDGLGARPAAAMAARKLHALGVRSVPRGPHDSTRANAYGLTRRQQEVMSLLAEGLTDAEIGERLFLATKTVNHHVSAILTKLGVRSRTEAVARMK
jgi:DNA-binding CsgD family transcriptional regulator